MQFEAVYRAHYADIWRCLRRFGVSEREAHDATQEVFMVALRKLADFAGRSSVRTWLIGIAYRVAANRRRSAAGIREVLGDQALALAEASLDSRADETDSLRLVEKVLAKLPLEQRAVFTMFELEQMSGDDIASALGIPVGTVRSRLRLARKHFALAAGELAARQPSRTRVGGA
ncbi:MAG: RNA polymerase sigma factor [Myxococcota bacterium]